MGAATANTTETAHVAFEIDPVEDLSAAVDWFVEVIGPRTDLPFGPPEDRKAVDRDLQEIDEVIAPLLLPSELRWFWQTWDPDAFHMTAIAELCRPSFALRAWEDDARDGDMPRALFPVGYVSHQFLELDLTGPPDRPANLWSMEYTGLGFTHELPSLAALMRTCAECAEAAQLDPAVREPADGNWRWYYNELFDSHRFESIAARHRSAAAMRRETIEFDPRAEWPEPWQEAEQVAVSEPKGPTHTAAQFESLLPTGSPRARLRGSLARQNSPGSGQLFRFTDASGSIDVIIPVDGRPPGVEKALIVEIDVVGRGPVPLRPSTSALESHIYGTLEDRLRGEHDQAAFEAVAKEYELALHAYGEVVPLVERVVIVAI